MRNSELAGDYVQRADVRLRALDVLYEASSWADVVRESQEALELALKGLLRACGIEPPRIHDVADVLLAERDRLPAAAPRRGRPPRRASRATFGRDRELAFYGAEDLTPSQVLPGGRRDARPGRRAARRTSGQAVRPGPGLTLSARPLAEYLAFAAAGVQRYATYRQAMLGSVFTNSCSAFSAARCCSPWRAREASRDTTSPAWPRSCGPGRG